LRFYKKYLYWQLVSNDREFCVQFEKTLKTIRFTEDSLKYEYLPKSLRQSLIDKIQQIVYNKEAAELKASPEKIVTQSHLIANNGNESGGWRKKSNDLTPISKEDTGMYKVNRFSDNRSSQSSQFSDIPKTRERFNSDGDKGGYQGFSRQVIPLNNYVAKLDYSKLTVKYRTEGK